MASLKINVINDNVSDAGKSSIAPKSRVLKPKTRLTLEDAWRRAEAQFAKDNDGKELGGFQAGGKQGVIDSWKMAYKPRDGEERGQSDRMVGILTDILNGVELLGGLAAQAASTAFPPAGMCFSAIDFLINAPAEIRKVYDGLKQLFEEVQKFLVQFRIYQRIDDKFGLDEDLILDTNNLLISFVRICGLSTKLLNRGKWTTFKTAFKVVLFRDDSGIPGELENFRRLVDRQSKLTGTVALEHILESEERINQVKSDTAQLVSGISLLVAASNDEKTKFVNTDRLRSIERKLFKKSPPKDDEFLPVSTDELLPGTFEELQATASYQEWADTSTSSAKVLVISGPLGSGKTRLLDAIKSNLDTARALAERDAPSTYVAAYTFAEKRGSTGDGEKLVVSSKKIDQSHIPHALRVLAWQVASQSTTYAKDLASRLQTMNQLHTEDDVEKIWEALELVKVRVPNSVLYILLDAVDPNTIKKLPLLKRLSMIEKDTAHYPKVRILLTLDSTGSELSAEETTLNWLRISAADINRKLIVPFVRNEMQQQNLFQDSDRQTRRTKQEILRKLTTKENISFGNVRGKLNRIREGIEKGLPRDVISKIIDESDVSNTSTEGDGQRTLAELEHRLNPTDIALLRGILMWLIGSRAKCMGLQELEAALSLSGANLPIESLVKKINTRFMTALYWSDNTIYVHDNVQNYLDNMTVGSQSRQSTSDEAFITLDISVKNATQEVVKQFIWDLNEHMTNGRFDFSQVKSKGNQIHLDPLEIQLTITSLCFKLLNEGWSKKTEPLLDYAYTHVSAHLASLVNMKDFISRQARKKIGENLVGFLTDPYPFEQRHQHHGRGIWMLEADNINAIKFWLTDHDTKEQLTLKEQRWVDKVTRSEDGILLFLEGQALSIGRRWLSDRKCDSNMMWDWIDTYLLAISLKIGEPTPEPEPESENVLPENKDENVAEADVKTDSAVDESGDNKPIDGDTHVDEVVQPSQETDLTAVLINGDAKEEKNGPLTAELEQRTDRINLSDNVSIITSPPVQADSSDPLSATSEANNEASSQPNGNTDTEKSSVQDKLDQDGLDKDSDSDNDEADPVAVARKWVMDRITVQKGPEYHMTLGETYMMQGNQKRALKHYRHAVKDVKLEPYAQYGMARAFEYLEQFDECFDYVEKSMSTFQQMADDQILDNDEFDTYLNMLTHFGNLASGRGETDKALLMYEEASKRKPEDRSYRWTVLRLLCAHDESQNSALQFLRRWTMEDNDLDHESPALSMLEMAEEAGFDNDLMPIARSIRDLDLREAFLAVTTEAIMLAGNIPVGSVHCRLHYLRGLACAFSLDTQDQARQYWEKVLTSVSQEAADDTDTSTLLGKAAFSITKCKFDALRLEVASDTGQSSEEKRLLQQELRTYIKSTTEACLSLKLERGVSAGLDSFVIAFSSLCGLEDEARKLCKDDMAQALGILSDDDPDNDSFGLKVLARIFCRLGDKVGVSTAVSLLDRKILVSRLESGTQELDIPEKIESGWYHVCDSCQKWIYSSDTDGFWWCQFCPDFDLCPECKDDYTKGKPRVEMCSPAHVPWYMNIKHMSYSREELEPQRVRIDWKYMKQDDGSTTRQGGRVVAVDEWVMQLREEWDLPKIDDQVSRAQK